MSNGGMTETGVMTFTADVALAARRRVKIKSATTTTPPEVEYAGAGEQHVGITEFAAAADELIGVRLRNAPGSRLATASEALAKGAAIYGAANGKVADTASGTALGVALEAAGADDDIIEILDDNGGF